MTLGVLAHILVAHTALAQLSEESGATNEFRMKLAARGADNIPEIDPTIPVFHVGPATGGQGRGSLSAEGGANPAFDTTPSAARNFLRPLLLLLFFSLPSPYSDFRRGLTPPRSNAVPPRSGPYCKGPRAVDPAR